MLQIKVQRRLQLGIATWKYIGNFFSLRTYLLHFTKIYSFFHSNSIIQFVQHSVKDGSGRNLSYNPMLGLKGESEENLEAEILVGS